MVMPMVMVTVTVKVTMEVTMEVTATVNVSWAWLAVHFITSEARYVHRSTRTLSHTLSHTHTDTLSHSLTHRHILAVVGLHSSCK